MLGESWSEKRKAEIETVMMARGFKLLEHIVIGDFDLALWIGTGNDELKGIKVLSVNSGEIDPGSIEGQATQTTPQFLNWSKVLALLQIWVDRYGKLLVGSAESIKLSKYRRALGKKFSISDYDEDQPMRGFFIDKDA
jgi:hypothetical protein